MNSRKHARLRKIQRARQLQAWERRVAQETAQRMAEQFNEMIADHMLDALVFGMAASGFRIEPAESAIELQGRRMTLRDSTYSNVATNTDEDSMLTVEKLEAVVKRVERELGPIPKPDRTDLMSYARWWMQQPVNLGSDWWPIP
jgi:hypothetical protein